MTNVLSRVATRCAMQELPLSVPGLPFPIESEDLVILEVVVGPGMEAGESGRALTNRFLRQGHHQPLSVC